MVHTTHRNYTFAAIRAGKYAHIRTMTMWNSGEQNPNQDHCHGCTTDYSNASQVPRRFVLLGKAQLANLWQRPSGDPATSSLLGCSAWGSRGRPPRPTLCGGPHLCSRILRAYTVLWVHDVI